MAATLTLKHELISEEIAVIEVVGDLDLHTSPWLRELAIDLIRKGHRFVVLDLSRTDFSSTDGLGVILGAMQYARSREGTVNIVGISERMLKLFIVTGVIRVFKMYDSVPDAIESIHADSAASGAPLGDSEFGWHWFPARIYTSEENAGPAVESALSELLDTFGMDLVFGFSPESGSWFREFILRLKDSTALPTRDEALNLMQRAIEQQVLGVPQSRIDVAQSQAVAGLLAALEKTPNAVVQCGSVLLIKVRDVIVVRNLTQLELAHWERNPGLFRDPEKALSELQRAWDSTSAVDEPQDTSSA